MTSAGREPPTLPISARVTIHFDEKCEVQMVTSRSQTYLYTTFDGTGQDVGYQLSQKRCECDSKIIFMSTILVATSFLFTAIGLGPYRCISNSVDSLVGIPHNYFSMHRSLS
jgi:hypothetical protein